MKTIKSFLGIVVVKICLGVALLSIINCEKPLQEEAIPMNTDAIEEVAKEDNWVGLLEEFNFNSIILVQQEDAIMQALKEAAEGDVVFVEAGNYKEDVSLDNLQVSLVGVTGNTEEKVTISDSGGKEFNIPLLNDIQNGARNSSLSAKQSKGGNRIVKITRSEICNGVAHYQFKVRVGDSPFDVIRIHRLVKEHRPFRPVKTKGDIFMIHGGSQDFDDIFLRPGVENANTQNSSPVYLASNNIDVWGIDLGWTLVPAETSDFSFMRDWGIQRDVDHTLVAMSIARLVRGFTRQGFGRINLLGFSYGVSVAYAAAGRETQQRKILRDVGGLIPAEGALKFAPEDEALRQRACAGAAAAQEAFNNGVYQTSNGVSFAPIGDLALTSPDDVSPFNEQLTNYQFAIGLGAASGNGPTPTWHFVGGDFNEMGMPIGLLYTHPSQWFELLRSLAPHQPQLHGLESSACLCDEEDVSIDDYLNEIKVPILYLGAAGGYGEKGTYTSSLTQSNDITQYIVSEQDKEFVTIDYGHADIFMGSDASFLIWDELRDWLADHPHHRGR